VGSISSEFELVDKIGVRASRAVELIDLLASRGYIELMAPVGGFGSKATRSVADLTHRGREHLEDNPV
jgi:hypothetical protein